MMQLVLVTQFAISIAVALFVGRVEGRYDSELIKTSGDVLRLDDGKIWQSFDKEYSWKKLGTYKTENGFVHFSFESENVDKQTSVTGYLSIFGIRVTKEDKIKHGLAGNYIFTRNIFGLE